MARVAYDRPFSQVGFRPTRKTNPFAAAHRLSGMSDDPATLDVTVQASPPQSSFGELVLAGVAAWLLIKKGRK